MPAADAPRIFLGIGKTYERVGAFLSFGQDPRWRSALVSSVAASPEDRVLDVATGTGLVARELIRRYGCAVVGIDQSAGMLAAAAARNGHIPLIRGRAERLPFPDESFDHLTFTYLLRYVDDPAATMRELARVLKPGGRIAMVEFGIPRGVLRALWWLYTRIGLPLAGRVVSADWAAVGAFLGPSIERFYAMHPQNEIERYWREAGFCEVSSTRMSLGGGLVMSAQRNGLAGATEGPRAVGNRPPGRGVRRRVERVSVAPAESATSAVQSPDRSAFYALAPGGLRDYWSLLHPPYTAWHLSYVLMGASLSPAPDARIVGGALLAFFLGVGIAAHAFDELQGRPLGTRIPNAVLIGLGSLGLIGAVALGAIAATQLGAGFLVFVAVGAALVVLYGTEAPFVHSDVGFALGWGGFPVLTAAFATGAPPIPAGLVAIAASLLSLAQRRLSTPVRRIRRKSTEIRGTITYRDGTTEPIDRRLMIAAPEAALRLLWLAMAALSVGSLLARWRG
jgi:demethylmenaquinone methyltransferase / 2-methoxy-6-polyprenyl-1,4-benzoquinol methylase